jgi:hypothetical protein
MVDVEADGPIPGDYSMTEIGAVLVNQPDIFFHSRIAPISNNWVPEALAVSGYSREETLNYPTAISVMSDFRNWLATFGGDKLRFISDNNGFDFSFVNWYFHHFIGENPFGHSSTNLGSLYKGLVKDDFKNFKHLRKTKHTHNPVDDCLGNIEALVHMKNVMGLNIKL